MMLHLDHKKTCKLGFEEKLVPRSSSQSLLVEVLREVLLAQQSPAEVEAPMLYPAVLSTLELRVLWDAFLASRFRPLAEVLRESNAGDGARRVAPAKPVPKLAVESMEFNLASTMILAGVPDGVSAAWDRMKRPDDDVNEMDAGSVVTKHATIACCSLLVYQLATFGASPSLTQYLTWCMS